MPILNNRPLKNPAFDPEVKTQIYPLDEHMFLRNAHKLPVDLYLSLLPAWGLRAALLAATSPLETKIKEYLSIRVVMMSIDGEIMNNKATVDNVHFIFKEIKKLYDAYESYAKKVKKIRDSVERHTELFTRNQEVITADLGISYQNYPIESTLRSFGIQMCSKEYLSLGEKIEESLENVVGIIKCAVDYLVAILERCPKSYDYLSNYIENKSEEREVTKLKLSENCKDSVRDPANFKLSMDMDGIPYYY